MIPMQGQMATSLHSCGNQIMGCPCGCRKHPFIEQRLQNGGLHGLLVQLAGESKCGNNIYPNFRHITPDELAVLNGMLPGCDWGSHPMWVGTDGFAFTISMGRSMCNATSYMRTLDLGEPCEPEVTLLKLMGNLLRTRDEVFGEQSRATAIAFSHMIHAMSFTQGKTHELTVDGTNPEESKVNQHAMHDHRTAQVPDETPCQDNANPDIQAERQIPEATGALTIKQVPQASASETSESRLLMV